VRGTSVRVATSASAPLHVGQGLVQACHRLGTQPGQQLLVERLDLGKQLVVHGLARRSERQPGLAPVARHGVAGDAVAAFAQPHHQTARHRDQAVEAVHQQVVGGLRVGQPVAGRGGWFGGRGRHQGISGQ